MKVNIADLSSDSTILIRKEVARYSDALSVGRTKQC